MKTLRRFHIENALYFITAITYNRSPILLIDTSLFWQCWGNVRPTAWVILPDHFHIMVNPGLKHISDAIHHFKISYSRTFRDRIRPGPVWQNRFWDHIIRDDSDYRRHMDYIHYNPVKHGLIDDPFTYAYSSLQEFYEQGYYTRDWMVDLAVKDGPNDDFGE